ncbi:hypothetical protein J8Z86_22260, partial [Yersinia enterocolitica]|uniref:hypothetical protein n=1 Tax=Yersinia enterocolitica TaxID=630 RepID=UPI001C8EE8CA
KFWGSVQPRPPWRGRFTLLPAFTLQDRVVEVCQQSEAAYKQRLFYLLSNGFKLQNLILQ